ncbi:MAG: hypothetical protein WBW93_03830 [Steroidobacteraceae bacterium]
MTSEGWKRVGQWHAISEDGHYTVACVRVNGAYRFEAWYLRGGKDASLGVFDDAESAREVCRKHQTA